MTHRWTQRSRLALGGVLVASLGLAFSPVHAQTITYSVNTTADTLTPGACATHTSGCSLREAITEANTSGSPVTISVPAGHYQLTQPGMSLDPVANTQNIIGAGAPITSIDATGNGSRVFTISSPAIVTLQGLTITGGTGGDTTGGAPGASNQGGGIYNDGTLSLLQDVVTHNTLSGGNEFGGGLYQNSATMLTVGSTTFSSNTATGVAAIAEGGAVYLNAGTPTFTSTSFIGNSASGGFGSGGAVFNLGGIHATYRDTTWTNNTASATRAVAYGGGLSSGGTDTFVQVRMTGNSASGTGGAIAEGGAIYSDAESLSVTGPAIFSTNAATSTNFTGSAVAFGGAIYGRFTSLQGPVSVNGNTASANSSSNFADAEGGGVYTGGSLSLDRVTINGNIATATSTGSGAQAHVSAGGAFVYGPISDHYVSLVGNTATATAPTGGTVTGWGGGLVLGGPFRQTQTVTLSYATIERNSVTTSIGGVAGPSYGGGIFDSNTSSSPLVSLYASRVDHNTAETNGGGIYNPNDPVLLSYTPVVLNTLLHPAIGACPNTVTPCT